MSLRASFVSIKSVRTVCVVVNNLRLSEDLLNEGGTSESEKLRKGSIDEGLKPEGVLLNKNEQN